MPALPTFCRSLLAALFLGAAVCGAAAQANPDDIPDDPVTTLLVERGLLKTRGADIVHKMRDKASELVVAAMNFLGVPYRRGGASAESGFDCSGFTRHIFELSLGVVLPRRVDEQAHAPGLVQVTREELKPGDLVFFNTLKRTFSHVGIYVGDGRFIHAPRAGARVRLEDLRDTYWARRFTGARRAPLVAEAGEPAQSPP